MVKIALSGYGKMGHMVEEELLRRGIAPEAVTNDVASLSPALARECVCIDFTTPEAFRRNYPLLAERFKAVVVGTTGWDDLLQEVRAAFEAAGTPMVHSANFSLGVNALLAAVQRACALLREAGYAPCIEEIHHIHKLDAPSGTAKVLAACVEKALGVAEVPIQSIRRGEEPGVHTLTLESRCDRLTFRHEAFSRAGFAQGAVAAALHMEQVKGVHTFSEVLWAVLDSNQ